MYAFEGKELARARFTPTLISHTDDISLRFKTFKKDGLLFKTTNDINDDTLQLFLEDGKGRLDTNLGGEKRVNNYFMYIFLHLKYQYTYFSVANRLHVCVYGCWWKMWFWLGPMATKLCSKEIVVPCVSEIFIPIKVV